MKYIDADLLRKEIEVQRDLFIGHAAILKKTVATDGFDVCLRVINSLQQEQPEVDLEKEIVDYWTATRWSNVMTLGKFKVIARHFYKLGKNSK